MSQKLPVNNFPWVKYTSKFNYVFIKSYNEESNKEYFVKVDVQYLEKFHELHHVFLFLPERIKIEKVQKLVDNLHDKTDLQLNLKTTENLKI